MKHRVLRLLIASDPAGYPLKWCSRPVVDSLDESNVRAHSLAVRRNAALEALSYEVYFLLESL